ncbi:hypothetical protein PQR08_25235 [Caballeronia jiangsuensis]|uniref:Uncharacterized protein n=1 Tax=Caballeronia jiangsuensis TaxID=1458357 RepID=A0ABW9CSX5_9BURK
MAYYFAYGLDMQNDALLPPAIALMLGGQAPEPSAQAVLSDCALTFRRSTINTNTTSWALTEAHGRMVWGVLVDLPSSVISALAEAKAETHDRVQKSVTVQLVMPGVPLPSQLVVGEQATAICLVPRSDSSEVVLPDSDLLRRVINCALSCGFPIKYVRAIAAGGVGAGMTVDEIKIDAEDITQQKIERIFYKAPPRFAVYAADKRVMVQYADDSFLEVKQRTDMASLNGLRSQINGLIDGWQTSRRIKKQTKAAKYNARVAAALNLCLEGDGINALIALQEVKADIVDERASWGRFEYLMSALFTAILFCVGLTLVRSRYYAFDIDTQALWNAARAGAIGAFFSIAIAIRQRTVLTDLRWVDNLADAALRIAIGVIAATVLALLLRTNLAPAISIGGAENHLLTGKSVEWDMVVTIGFIAGFLERLVPDMLSKAETSNGALKGK